MYVKARWRGSGLGEHPKHFGTPYFSLQPLKLATSNLVHNLGLASSIPKKQHLGPKLAGVWARGAYQKFWDALLISATIEASNFKFGTQVGFGECVTITALVKNLVGPGWLVYKSTSKIVWTRCHILCTT